MSLEMFFTFTVTPHYPVVTLLTGCQKYHYEQKCQTKTVKLF